MKAQSVFFIFFMGFVVIGQLRAQQGNKILYYRDIEPIILKNCQPCHSPDQSGPFSLLSYEDVKSKGTFIAHVTKSKYMPPWKADSDFQQYSNERGLKDEEIELIQQWVKGGMIKGKKNRTEKHKIKLEEVIPDLSLQSNSPFKIPDTSVEEYRFFSVPTNLSEDKFVTSIEFIPGNRRLVHHSRIMTDTSHFTRKIDGLSAENPKIREFDKHPPLDRFFYGWVPGNFRFNFPPGTGKKLHKDTDFVVNIHYAPNSKINQTDQSTINLFFSKEKVEREVYALTIEESSITNQPFLLKANTTPTFYASFGPIPIDITAFAVLPHMHYLGKTFKAFAVTPDGEAIHLIKIDSWDFRWQSTYEFKTFLHIPKNSVILIEASYDNTDKNPENQFTPPKDITYGWNSTSEMMNLVIYYLLYKSEDEKK